MTDDQIIAIIGDVASFAAATAAMLAAWGTFRTVRQMQIQTTTSYRPELTLGRVTFTGYSRKEVGPIPSHWRRDTNIPNQENIVKEDHDSDKHTRPSISLYNIGLAAAADICIRWEFPIESIVNEVNKLAQRALVPAYFDYNREVLRFDSELWPMSRIALNWRAQKSENLDYILPESTQKTETLVEIPSAVTHLVSAYIYFSIKQNTEKAGMSLDSIPSLHADISYSDIAGQTLTVRFELRSIVSAASPEWFRLSLDPRRVKAA
jgi:hypothetical protein